jgi:hypothetical protein
MSDTPELEVIQLPLTSKEFHLIVILVDSVAARMEGDIVGLLHNLALERAFCSELGAEGFNALSRRLDTLHNSICPGGTDVKVR